MSDPEREQREARETAEAESWTVDADNREQELVWTAEEFGVPEHIRAGLAEYVIRGTPTGGFLEALLCNDLREACGRADDTNAPRLVNIVKWLYNETPAGCWGSVDKYLKWSEGGGLKGIERRRAEVVSNG